MPQATELERFAQTLIQLVRDEAIEACDRLLSPGAVGPTAKHWAAVAPGADARRALLELIPDIVDQTLFRVLDAADNDELPLAWRKADGSSVSLSELGLGEMAGWPGVRWMEGALLLATVLRPLQRSPSP